MVREVMGIGIVTISGVWGGGGGFELLVSTAVQTIFVL